MPRAAAISSVTSWSGPAAPSSDATAGDSAWSLGDHDPAAWGQRLGDERRGLRAEDRGGSDPQRPDRGEGLPGPLGPGIEAGSFGEHEHDRGVGPGRREVAVEERLQVTDRGREPRRLLDLERELARRDPVDARPDDEQLRGARDDRGDRGVRSCPGGAPRVGRLDPVAHSPPQRTRRDGFPGERCSHGGRRGDRGHVAHGVAPAAIHLDGRQDRVRPDGARRCRAARDQRRPSARRPARGQRAVGGRGAAFMADPDHHAAVRRIEGELERL